MEAPTPAPPLGALASGGRAIRNVQPIADQLKLRVNENAKPIWRTVKELDSEKLKKSLVKLIRQYVYDATIAASCGNFNSGTFFKESDPNSVSINLGDLMKEYEAMKNESPAAPPPAVTSSSSFTPAVIQTPRPPPKRLEAKNVFGGHRINPLNFVSSLSLAVKHHSKPQPTSPRPEKQQQQQQSPQQQQQHQHQQQPSQTSSHQQGRRPSLMWFENLKHSFIGLSSPRSRISLPEPIRYPPAIIQPQKESATYEKLPTTQTEMMRMATTSASTSPTAYTPFSSPSLGPNTPPLSEVSHLFNASRRRSVPVVQVLPDDPTKEPLVEPPPLESQPLGRRHTTGSTDATTVPKSSVSFQTDRNDETKEEEEEEEEQPSTVRRRSMAISNGGSQTSANNDNSATAYSTVTNCYDTVTTNYGSSPPAQSLPMSNEASDTTSTTSTTATNYGVATTNYADSTTTNYGVPTTNYAASATTNYGTATTNYGTATTNYGTVTTNYGTATTNYGTSSNDGRGQQVILSTSPSGTQISSPIISRTEDQMMLNEEIPDLNVNYGIDWNKEYQDQISKIRELEAKNKREKKSPLEPDSEMSKILLAHQELFVAFNYAAKTYAQVIINEVCIPDEEKTIPPSNLGGIAGGEKYIVKGIVFKFAQDKMVVQKPKPLWMYGGDGPNHKLAIKAAGKEFLAMEAFIAHSSASEDCEICYPLMAIVDYKGFRIIATPLLPIDKATIIYGSNDGGRTVHADDPQVNKAMELIAAEMRIKGHRVGITVDKSKYLYSCGDFEIHRGKDGRLYALDFGRLLPPESPGEYHQHDKRSVYYNFLRPEFTIYQDIPLSPDSFSLWSKLDEEKEENENNLRSATKKLFNSIIPKFASEWETEFTVNFNAPFLQIVHNALLNVRMVEKARFRGINMRHLGLVRKHLKSQPHKKLVLSNCVARVIRNAIEEEWRNLMVLMKGTPTDLPFRSIFCNKFNLVIGRRGRLSNLFWFKEVKEMLQSSFPEILNAEELNPRFDLRDRIDLRAVVFYASAMVGAVFRHDCAESLMTDPTSFEMLEIDITEFAPKLRQPHIHFTSYSKLFRLAMSECTDENVFARLYSTCFGLCTIGAKIYPTSPEHNLESSYVVTLYVTRNIALYQKQPTNELFTSIEEYFDHAFQKVETSISCSPDELNLLQWARVAHLFSKWLLIRGYQSLSQVYEDKANEITNVAEKVKTLLSSSSHDGAYEYRKEALKLSLFRHTTPTGKTAISPIARRKYRKSSATGDNRLSVYTLEQLLLIARLAN